MSYEKEHRKDMRKRICTKCYFYEVCPIDQDCYALDLVETYEDIFDNNTDQ